jgi:3-methyladenine DNA glycosylase AlkD
MNKPEVISLLKGNTNERGLVHWEKMGDDRGGLESFGIGLTQLRKLAKQVGKNHELALELWESDNHDTKVIGLLIDEPRKITREQIEEQVEGTNAGYLAHVFSSCDATLAKSPLAFEVAKEWITHKDANRRRCAYGLIYELSKKPKHKGMTDEFCLGLIDHIEKEIVGEADKVRVSMGGALIGMGKRNKVLNEAAVKLAKVVSPIDYDAGDTSCEPLDVMKHLTSDYIKKKFGV